MFASLGEEPDSDALAAELQGVLETSANGDGLIDLPEGSATQILAIAIVAPEARCKAVIEAAIPVVDPIEFHGQEAFAGSLASLSRRPRSGVLTVMPFHSP